MKVIPGVLKSAGDSLRSDAHVLNQAPWASQDGRREQRGKELIAGDGKSPPNSQQVRWSCKCKTSAWHRALYTQRQGRGGEPSGVVTLLMIKWMELMSMESFLVSPRGRQLDGNTGRQFEDMPISTEGGAFSSPVDSAPQKTCCCILTGAAGLPYSKDGQIVKWNAGE